MSAKQEVWGAEGGGLGAWAAVRAGVWGYRGFEEVSATHVTWTGLRDEWAMGVNDTVRERQIQAERTLAKGKACYP